MERALRPTYIKSPQKKEELQPSSSTRVKLFIGSLPPSCQNRDVYKAFKFYGKVLSVNLFRDYKSGLCKGFGDLSLLLDGPSTISHLLKQKFHIKGRKIYVEQFLEGDKLKEKNSDLYRKRVHIKQIPRGITDEEMKNLFKEFGEVESAYQIKKVQGYSMPFGYVTFLEIEAAHRCLKQKYVVYKGFKMECCEFKRREINKKKKNEKFEKKEKFNKNVQNFRNQEIEIEPHEDRGMHQNPERFYPYNNRAHYDRNYQNNETSVFLSQPQISANNQNINHHHQNSHFNRFQRRRNSQYKDWKRKMREYCKKINILPGDRRYNYMRVTKRHHGDNIKLRKI